MPWKASSLRAQLRVGSWQEGKQQKRVGAGPRTPQVGASLSLGPALFRGDWRGRRIEGEGREGGASRRGPEDTHSTYLVQGGGSCWAMNTQLVRMVHMMSMLKSVGQGSRKTTPGGGGVSQATRARGAWHGARHSQVRAASSMRQSLQEDTLELCPVLTNLPTQAGLCPLPGTAGSERDQTHEPAPLAGPLKGPSGGKGGRACPDHSLFGGRWHL